MINLETKQKQPKLVSMDVLIAYSVIAILCYFLFSKFDNELLAEILTWIIIIFALLQFLINYIKNSFVSYVVDKNKITINRGVILKKLNSINFDSVTNITISRNIFDLLFGISGRYPLN